MGTPDRQTFTRKTIPQADQGSSLHQNGDLPPVRVVTERFNVGQTPTAKLLPWNNIDVVRPLIPVTQLSVGGVRVIGGGTSREALSRAKRGLKSRRP